jgi:2-dehydro-3-deoxyphosphogluconate aldolase/(4S)-4-hydroxy-2-oxoglutarate aldolase
MTNDTLLSRIAESGVVAVIRLSDARRLRKVLAAISSGGVRCLEITMTVPGAVEVIREVAASAPPGVLVGAGTVTDLATAAAVMDAGAQFVVGPILSIPVIQAVKERGCVAIPGCFSPTEILTAWRAGADVVKIFPATSLGPRYIKDLHGPFPELRLMPTGGVSLENVGQWIRGGAFAVGVGTDLLDKTLIQNEDYKGLEDRARQFVSAIGAARALPEK